MDSPDDKNNNKDKLAIALEYDRAKDPAPRVVASGQGHIAAQIIEVAKQHNIEIRKDAELAQILSVLDVDSVIPVEAYASVAEILSYIYKANRQSKTKS
jgi:flagellar biosynthesis protein